jgi:hypothetical protein
MRVKLLKPAKVREGVSLPGSVLSVSVDAAFGWFAQGVAESAPNAEEKLLLKPEPAPQPPPKAPGKTRDSAGNPVTTR